MLFQRLWPMNIEKLFYGTLPHIAIAMTSIQNTTLKVINLLYMIDISVLKRNSVHFWNNVDGVN